MYEFWKTFLSAKHAKVLSHTIKIAFFYELHKANSKFLSELFTKQYKYFRAYVVMGITVGFIIEPINDWLIIVFWWMSYNYE